MLNDLLGRNRKHQLPDHLILMVAQNQTLKKFLMVSIVFFLTNIGPKLADRIPVSDAHFSDFLVNIQSPMSSLFLSPTDSEEIVKICSTLKPVSAVDKMRSNLMLLKLQLIVSPHLWFMS